MTDVYSIQGFLWKYKKGVTGGSWKKNWVYADSTVITQYGGNQRPLPNEAPKYKWKIADCAIRSSDLRRFAFEVTMHGGGGAPETAIFAADDSNSFEKWMKILIDTHIERERQEQSQSEIDSYHEVEAVRGGEEVKDSSDVKPWQRVEQQAKDFFKRNKAKGTLTVADLLELIHIIDERLVPHRVLTFLAIETKRTLDSAISLPDFLSFWRLYHYLFLPSEEEFHVFYSKDSRDVCFSPSTTASPTTHTHFSEFNLLSSLSPELGEVKVHPLYFRMHIPTTATSPDDNKTRGLLLSLFQCYSPNTTNTASLEAVSGGWHEVQCDLLHRIEEVRGRIKEVYEQRLHPSLEAKKAALSEVLVAPVVVERRGSAVTSSSELMSDPTSELRALDEELLQLMSALSLLQAQFLGVAMKGARTLIDEFTLPQHLKTMKCVASSPHASGSASGTNGSDGVGGDDVMVCESHGIHFQLLNCLNLLQPSSHHSSTNTGTTLFSSDAVESALIARESLYDKYVAQEVKSFHYLNHSLQKRLLLQQIQLTYFPYLTSSPSSEAISSLRRLFLVQKMMSVVDYGGFRVLAFVPNHPPNHSSSQAVTSSSLALSEEQRASLLGEVQKGLAVKLPDGQVGIEAIALAPPSHSHPLQAKTAVTSRTSYYLTCKLLLPCDLTALHTSEVYMKSLRPELLQAYVTHLSYSERDEPREPPLILSAKELLDLYRDNTDVSGRSESPSLPLTTSSSSSSQLFWEWREVCRFLYRQRIPRFVELLDSYDVIPYDSLSLADAMHCHGLNMRHLGVIYSLSRNVIAKQLLLSDVIARGVKAVVRAMTKAHVYGQKQLSVVAERRQRSTASDYDELNAVTQTTKTDIIIEVLNLLFPTTSNTPSNPANDTSAPESQQHYLHYLRSHRKEEVLHFYELLLHVIKEKFGLTLTLSPHYSRVTSSEEKEEKEVVEGLTSEHPLAHYSLHCFQLLSAVTYHLQVRLKEHVFHTSSPSSGGGSGVTSASRSVVFSSNSMMAMKARDLTVLDLLDHRIATPSPTSFHHYDADDGVRLSSAGGLVYREEYSLLLPSFFPFLAHQLHLLSDVTAVHSSYGRRLREEMTGMVTWRERQLVFSEHLFDHAPNDPTTYSNYLKEVFAVAWSKWQLGGQEATYLLIEEKFLHRATFLHEYSLYNIPLFLLLMVVQYTQYESYTQAMINYDLAHDVITTILPFSHPMLTLPMIVLAELYLTYPSQPPSHLLEEDEKEAHYRSARKESLEYAKFFYQLALSVWRYTAISATSSHHNLSSSAMTKTTVSATASSSSSSSAVLPVLVLQYKLAVLQIELGELSEAVPVLQSCSKTLETLLNSLLHQNYSSHTSSYPSSSGKRSKEVEKEVQGERIQAMTIVLRLLIPAIYQLALSHYRLEEYDVALALYQKTYQLFNKIIFNDALTRAMTSDSPSTTSSNPFLSLMTQSFYELLLSSLLSMYDIYLLKHESELALDVLMLVYRLFVSRGYQSLLSLSSFYYYQHILWKLFCKMNELCIITLPMNVQALLESVTVEWNELMAGKAVYDTSAPTPIPSSPGRSSDVARQRKNNQKLFSVACKLVVEIMFRGEMMDYVIQLLQMIQKQIHEDNALRHQYHNSGSAQFGPLEFNPHIDLKQLVNSIPTYARAAAVSLLLKQPKEFAKYII